MPNAARKPGAKGAPATTPKKTQTRRLHVVSTTTATVEDQAPGDLDLTRETMSSWKAGQRTCRARKRHNWGPYTVWEHRNFYEVVEQCTHCRNRRSAEFVKTTYGLRKATPWKQVYRDGYLLPNGAARINEDLHDELTATDILSRRIVEVPDDDEQE